MRVSGLSPTGDWTMGAGRANYKRGSRAIQQMLVSRLRMFKRDWFDDVDRGIDWLNMPNAETLRAEVKRVALTTYGIKSIDRLRVTVDASRRARVELSVTDIYDSRFAEVLGPL